MPEVDIYLTLIGFKTQALPYTGPEIARVPGTREILRSYIMGPDEPALRSTLYYIVAPVDWNF